jgi:glycosyltransferase involved in cell wall biosynthesis
MFSVVIPLYNKEFSISKTIEYVLSQTLTEFEVIIVNDGSTDNSLKEVEKIDDKRIKIISQRNFGVSSARNLGIKESKHQWLAFLDGDDLWLPNHLEILNEMIRKYTNIRVFSTSYKHSNSKLIQKQDYNSYIITNYFKEIQSNKGFFCSSCALIHKSCFDSVGNFNENLIRGEDLEMWYRLGRSYSFAKSKCLTAIYRIDAENRAMSRSASFEKSFASVIDFIDVKDKYEYQYLKSQIRAKFKSCLYRKEWRSIIKLCIRFNYHLL